MDNAQPGRAIDWPLYQGTKQLKAIPMSKEAYCTLRGWTVPADEDPNELGYVVEYQDGGKPNLEGFAGYVSWSPADVFERAYHPIAFETEAMTFGTAVEAMKSGLRVSRAGWNGKGMFAYYVPAASYPVQTGAAKAHFGDNGMVPYRAYLALKTADGDVATWAPSCSDVLAVDWMVVDG